MPRRSGARQGGAARSPRPPTHRSAGGIKGAQEKPASSATTPRTTAIPIPPAMPPDAHRLTLAPPAAAGAHERSRAQRSRSTSALFGGYEYVYKDLRRILVLVITALVLLIVVSFTLPHLSF